MELTHDKDSCCTCSTSKRGRTWKAVPSISPKRAHANQACQPWGCFLPLAAAQATNATPAGSSRKALTNMGLVWGASSCVQMTKGVCKWEGTDSVSQKQQQSGAPRFVCKQPKLMKRGSRSHGSMANSMAKAKLLVMTMDVYQGKQCKQYFLSMFGERTTNWLV